MSVDPAVELFIAEIERLQVELQSSRVAARGLADECDRQRARIQELETYFAAAASGPQISVGGWQYTSGSVTDEREDKA